MNEPIFVKQYGVHFLDGQAFLHQKRDGTGEEIFSKKISPFHVSQKIIPPHRIDSSLVYDAKLPSIPEGFLNNRLVDLYLPKPTRRGGAHIICVSDYDCFDSLHKLSQLGSPSHDAVRLWSGNKNSVENDLATTNLIPLTILGWRLEASTTLAFIINLTRTYNRHFIASVEPMEPASTAIDLTSDYYAMLPMLKSLSDEELRIIGTHFFIRYIQNLLKNHEQNSTY